MKKLFFKTFGCRTNFYDTQVMMSNLKSYQITENEDEADIIVVNSCTVTNDADKGVRNYISSKKSKHIIYTGCGFKHNAEEFFKNGKIFGAFPHSKKEKIDEFLAANTRFFEPQEDETHIDNTIVTEFVGKSRAFIKIQEGCDFSCSYCIIPSVRGAARSMDERLIIKQIERLADSGFSEFILTGTNTGSYGVDRKSSIASLVKSIAKIKGVRRVRIGSLEPSQITDEFLELLNESFMASHLHIALQHTSDRMLEIMRRKNRVKSDMELFSKIASKNIALGTDFITGHPGETQEIWDEAYRAIKDFPLTHIHTFPYSDREATHSSTLKERVRGDVARERAAILRDLVASKNLEFRRKKAALEVLVEGEGFGGYAGFDQFFNRIHITSQKELTGKWLAVCDYKVQDDGNFTEL